MREVWRRTSRAKGQSFGRYKFALQRLGLQSEAIATFEGGVRECEIIEQVSLFVNLVIRTVFDLPFKLFVLINFVWTGLHDAHVGL